MPHFEYVIHAERHTLQRSGGIGGGLAQGGRGIPSGVVHGAIDGDQETLCGRPTQGLLKFHDHAFANWNRDLACEACRTAYDALGD
jgi:hypothetical protein